MSGLDIAELFAKYGPWGLVVVEGYVILHLYREARIDRRAHAKEVQDLNDRVVVTTEKQIGLLQAQTESYKKLTNAVVALAERED